MLVAAAITSGVIPPPICYEDYYHCPNSIINHPLMSSPLPSAIRTDYFRNPIINDHLVLYPVPSAVITITILL